MATLSLDPAVISSLQRFSAYELSNPTPVPQIMEALSHLDQLTDLSAAELQWLAEHGVEHCFPEGTLIFRSGEPASTMTILLRGEIHVRRHQSGPVQYFIGR